MNEKWLKNVDSLIKKIKFYSEKNKISDKKKLIDPWNKIYNILKKTRDIEETLVYIDLFINDHNHFNSRHQKTYFEIIKSSINDIKFECNEEAMWVIGWGIRVAKFEFSNGSSPI